MHTEDGGGEQLDERRCIRVVRRTLLPALDSPSPASLRVRDPVFPRTKHNRNKPTGCVRVLATDASAFDGCICSRTGHPPDASVELRLLSSRFFLCLHGSGGNGLLALSTLEAGLSRSEASNGFSVLCRFILIARASAGLWARERPTWTPLGLSKARMSCCLE